GPGGVGTEAEIRHHLIEFLQQVNTGVSAASIEHGGTKAGLRQHMAGHHDRQEHRRHQIGKNQHAVLRHLCIGDALHATEYRVEKYNRHANDDTNIHIHFEEACEHDTDTAHLPGHIGKRHEDHA